MSIGRFYGGIGALVSCRADGKILLLKRSAEKDFAAGAWECVTGRVDQGEGFEDAVRREVREELGVEVDLEFIIGTTHFHRGAAKPENELIGVVYACSLEDPTAIRSSPEHDEWRWFSPAEALEFLTANDPTTEWIRLVIERAEMARSLLPDELIDIYRRDGFELG